MLLARFANERQLDPLIESLVAENPESAVEELNTFVEHPDPEVRWLALKLMSIAATTSSNSSMQHDITRVLVEALHDESPLVSQHAAADLLRFDATDFTVESRARIGDLLREAPTPSTIRVAGVAEVPGIASELERFIDERRESESAGTPSRYGSVDWAARLARARLGSEADAELVVAAIRNERDEVLRVAGLLDDLAYTRSPMGMEVLLGYLDSTERLPQYSTAAPGTQVCQYALAAVAPMFDDFPVPLREPGAYSGTEIRAARRWLRDRVNWQGQL